MQTNAVERMKETNPHFLIRKYRSILFAAIIEELVVFVVSLTDTIVAGNLVGSEAIGAVGLVAPFLTVALFFAALINGGTMRSYTLYIGRFERDRANRFLSQGLLLAASVGILSALILLLVRGSFVESQLLTPQMKEQLTRYYTIILFYIMLEPLSALLDNLAVAEGGEGWAAFANIAEIVTNVGLSILLGMKWSLAGIGVATLLSKVLFVLLILGWFLVKKRGVRFVWHWNLRDCLLIGRTGIIRASTFAFTAITTLLLNSFTSQHFGSDALGALVIAQRYLGLSSLFLGVSMAIQPLIGTLRGEGNTKAERYLMRIAGRVTLLIGIFASLLIVFLARILVRIMGVEGGILFSNAVDALRISCATLFLQAILTLFFLYYFLTERAGLSFFLTLSKDLIFPLGLSIALSFLLGGEKGIWFGLMIAPAAVFLLAVIVILIKGGRKGFPLMLPREQDARIHIYDFDLDETNISDMAKTAEALAAESGYTEKVQTLCSLYLEETLMLVLRKNASSGKTIRAECTLVNEEEGLRLVLRDSGVIFNLSDADAQPDSFNQYVVGNMMASMEQKMYLKTTGYNRNEFFFKEEKA